MDGQVDQVGTAGSNGAPAKEITMADVERAVKLANDDLEALREVTAAGPAEHSSHEAFMEAFAARFNCCLISFHEATQVMAWFADQALARARSAVAAGTSLADLPGIAKGDLN